MNLSNSLNEMQIKAANSLAGPNIILAGAGSGKTRVLVYKVANLIEVERIEPSQIVMITFTNKAAREMQNRVSAYMNGKVNLGFAGTFHSFCVRVLREYGHEVGVRQDFLIYTGDDVQDALKIILKKLEIEKLTPSYFAHKISEAKSQAVSAMQYINVFTHYKAPIVAQVYVEYEKFLRSQNALDFDDLLLYASHLLKTRPLVTQDLNQKYKYIFIDEFQDTNSVQYSIARSLSGLSRNITVVGDFAQAIYSFRGADIYNLERFTKDFPDSKVFYLEQNYRSTAAILDYAYNAISANTGHPILKLYTVAEAGDEVLEVQLTNEEEESIYICKKIAELKDEYKNGEEYEKYSNFAVLYRTNAQSRSLEEAFLHYNVPYTLYGGVRFYERREIKDLLSYLRLIKNPQDEVANSRILKLGKRKYLSFVSSLSDLQKKAPGLTTAEVLRLVLAETAYTDNFNPQIEEEAARLDNISELMSVAAEHVNLESFFEHVSLVESEITAGEKKHKGAGVRLMSLHASKGLEFDTVFVVGLEEGLLPHTRSLEDEAAIEEERRLFYVGVTRAKRRLFVTHAKSRNIFGRRNFSTKSRFLQNKSTPKYESEYTSNVDNIIENWDIDPSVSGWQHTKQSKGYADDIEF